MHLQMFLQVIGFALLGIVLGYPLGNWLANKIYAENLILFARIRNLTTPFFWMILLTGIILMNRAGARDTFLILAIMTFSLAVVTGFERVPKSKFDA